LIACVRAAAFIALAAGVSDVLSVLAPRVEPMTLFLAAVAIVAWLDGVIVGMIAAAAAAATYAFFLLPPAERLSDRVVSIALLGAAIALAVGTMQLIRLRQRRERRAQTGPPLLSGEVMPPPHNEQPEVLHAIENLRADLASAFAELDRTRLAADERAALLESAAAAAREEARAAANERRELDGRVADLTMRLARAYEAASEAVQQRDAQAVQFREREAKFRQMHEDTRRAAEQRIAVMQGEVDLARTDSTAASRVLEHLRDRVQAAEARAETAEKQLATGSDATTELRRALETEREQREAQRSMLQRRFDEAAEQTRAALQEAAQLKATVATLQTQLDDAQAELVGERATRGAAESELSQALQVRVAELESELSESQKELLAATTAVAALRVGVEAADTIRTQVNELESQLAAARGDRDAAIKALDDVREEMNHELTGAARLRERMNELESELAEAESGRSVLTAQLEAAQREALFVDSLRTRVAELESELAEMITSRGAAESAQFAELESRLTEAVRARSEAESVAVAAEERADRADSLRTEIEQASRSLAADHGAHIRDLGARLEAAAAHTAEIEAQLAAEKAGHQARDHEFNTKLQNIVNHIAMDHEADLGQALMEKEAARAEVRSLNMRMTSLQQKSDEDRAAFQAAQEKWRTSHQALAGKLKQTEDWNRQGSEDSTAMLAKTRAAAQGEIDALRARIEELQYELMRRTPPSADTLPGVKGQRSATLPDAAPPAFGFAIVGAGPDPLDHARPRILVVHPDPELRAAAKESLQRIGYAVELAADGLEGLRMAIARPPDVVVADASMPKMDGRELCQLLKSQERTAAIKVVLLSRNDDERHGDRELEPDDVLLKPVKFDTLRTTLAQLAPVPN
jgi:CheY-like chemotaxis protein